MGSSKQSKPTLNKSAPDPELAASDAARQRAWDAWQAELGRRRAQHPEIEKLLASREWKEAKGLLEKREVRSDYGSKSGFEALVFGTVIEGLKGPTSVQKMTAGERKTHAKKLEQAAKKLMSLMTPIYEDRLSRFR